MTPAQWLLVPVKSFAAAKGRLAEELGADARADLARSMATHVLDCAGDLPVAVACDDDAVRAWALGHGATIVWCPGTDLNGAVTAGVSELADRGARRVVVAHSDLPLANSFEELLTTDGVVLVPDRHLAGTNVLVVPTGPGFTFSYGPGSFRRHIDEAHRLAHSVRIVRDESLGWDVDEPADLTVLEHAR
ncbi:MAG: 2-phospho-L-lactate guanylyltransferase [Acidimicrobiales bacterium]